MNLEEAAKYYSDLGIIVHPLRGVEEKVKSPGKQPMRTGWQRLRDPLSDDDIRYHFAHMYPTEVNIGFLTGRRSNLTSVDVDWYVKGIWADILAGVDTSNWVKQHHAPPNEEPKKWHYIFQYFPEVKAKQYQVLGFDILSDAEKMDNKGSVFTDGKPYKYIAGNNCVATPSLHLDGNKYQIIGNVAERPEIPKIVVKRINDVIKNYEEIKDKVLPKCRKPFRELWNAVFVEKSSPLYHEVSIFKGQENRVLFLATLPHPRQCNLRVRVR
jgi:putative DNA primase/helicase